MLSTFAAKQQYENTFVGPVGWHGEIDNESNNSSSS